MDEGDWLAERFEAHRPRLHAVAHRMLGSAAEADDAMQEAWLRLSRSGADGVENMGGWLTTIVARVCLDLGRQPRPAQGPRAGHPRRLRLSVVCGCVPIAASTVRSKSPADAPGPGTAVTERASSGSPQCEQVGTAVTMCPQAVCLVSSGGPPGAAHRSPHWRMAVTTCHRSRPFAVSRYSERGG